MIKTLIILAFVLYALPLYAVSYPPSDTELYENFQQRKADALEKINAVIVYRLEEKACVQAAKNNADLDACREKYKDEVKEQKPNKW